MKILLINNNTRHTQKLSQALMGHEVEWQLYEPGIDFHAADKDLIILSGGGGEGKELQDYHVPNKLWYEDEMEFVLACEKPILGICMGFEVIAAAYGTKVTEMPRGIEQYLGFATTRNGQKHFNAKKLWQFEGHDWRIEGVSSKFFEVLANSETGIEVIHHKTRPILATQFHPEFPGGDIQLSQLVKSLSLNNLA